jgi:hypothetical protein
MRLTSYQVLNGQTAGYHTVSLSRRLQDLICSDFASNRSNGTPFTCSPQPTWCNSDGSCPGPPVVCKETRIIRPHMNHEKQLRNTSNQLNSILAYVGFARQFPSELALVIFTHRIAQEQRTMKTVHERVCAALTSRNFLLLPLHSKTKYRAKF